MVEVQKSKHIGWLTTGSIVLIIFIFLSGLFLPQGGNWLVVISLMIGFVALIGKLITRRWSGILINERNKMTLSRFQLVLWTLIVLSALSTIALERIYASATGTTIADPLAIAIPSELWALLGISTVSFVGSPLILSSKVPKKVSGKPLDRAASLRAAEKIAPIDAAEDTSELRDELLSLKERNPELYKEAEGKKSELFKKANTVDAKLEPLEPQQMKDIKDACKQAAEDIARNEIKNRNVGPLDFNLKIEDAKFSELFTGDEVANRGFVDMGKVQMFFFTLIAAFSYMVLLVNLIWTTNPVDLTSFPQLEQGIVTLLGISSGGYLANKVPGKN